MLIREICMRNLLSFGPQASPLALRDLNVFIGPNGSGKSNFIDAIGLLHSAPRLLASSVRDGGGGIGDWLWKGERNPIASLEVLVENPRGNMPLRHFLAFTETAQRFELVDEWIENERAYDGHDRPYFYYRFENKRPVLNVKGQRRELRREDVDAEQSILSQRKDPDQYPEITYLGEQFDRIRVYREWSFGREAPPRQPQKADQRNDFLKGDCSNLGLVLNRMRRKPPVKARLLESLGQLYSEIDDFDVSVEGGTVQIFLQEGEFTIPGTRLSDGTLRYLCLLVLLCDPHPAPLLCIEEPELGLHPDLMPVIAELLKDASMRTQLVVTTHSEVLVDALSDTADDVVVCEKHGGESQLRRLDKAALGTWLEKYALGQLWRRGEIGGNRW